MTVLIKVSSAMLTCTVTLRILGMYWIQVFEIWIEPDVARYLPAYAAGTISGTR